MSPEGFQIKFLRDGEKIATKGNAGAVKGYPAMTRPEAEALAAKENQGSTGKEKWVVESLGNVKHVSS